jgi:Ca2+-binding EF-hand superfamily protein
MYDVDGNGYIDLKEMTLIVKSIFGMVGGSQVCSTGSVPFIQLSIIHFLQLSDIVEETETAESRAEAIFRKMDLNSDGRVTRQEFVTTCSQDGNLVALLSPNLQL